MYIQKRNDFFNEYIFSEAEKSAGRKDLFVKLICRSRHAAFLGSLTQRIARESFLKYVDAWNGIVRRKELRLIRQLKLCYLSSHTIDDPSNPVKQSSTTLPLLTNEFLSSATATTTQSNNITPPSPPSRSARATSPTSSPRKPPLPSSPTP